MLAVSTSDQITSSTVWRKWALDPTVADPGLFADYPSIGFDTDAIYITSNMFGGASVVVDLAVNNRDVTMTVAFLRRIVDAGHQIIGVCDEHNAEDWAKAFADAGLDFNGLSVKPVTGKGTSTNSSGALLLSLLGNEADEHTAELCRAADAGDRMDFTSHFGGMVNSAVKSKIADDSRRVKLAQHLATSREADVQIQGWIDEYAAILRNHEEIVGARVDLGDGMSRVDTRGKVVDMTAFMGQLYGLGVKIAVVDGESFNPAKKVKERQISFGCAPQLKTLDLVAALKAAGINASGFAQKANVQPEDEAKSVEVIRALLRG